MPSETSSGETLWDVLATEHTESKPKERPVQENALEVSSVFLYHAENSVNHHTDKFEMVHQEPPTLVLRRGDPFKLVVRFKGRPFDSVKDVVRLVFEYGPYAMPLKGTKGLATLSECEDLAPRSGLWDGRISLKHEKDIIVEVRSPADAPVGVWKLSVETSIKKETGAPRVYSHKEDIYLLFNPWLKFDLVHMENKRLLDEYVLNDVGKVWVGPHGSSRGRQWIYGQFDSCVLPACMLMLERAYLAPSNRGNPIITSRAISKMVNSNDDQGILEGRWSGQYSDGTAPGAWTGSVSILEQYLRTKVQVKYGQCWVYSAVTATGNFNNTRTVCRALGIPCRVVSNLVSAHDANASLTVDKYFAKDGRELSYDPNNPDGKDSVWNFHVWDEVWMARPDLPKGYGGWQAIDATPQETSDGVFQCGPASLEAIKRGNVGLKYDVPFLMSSVNADLIHWREDPTSDIGFRKIGTNTSHIGRMVITKLPWVFDPNGDKDMEDITLLYKSQEGTDMERTAMYSAARSDNARKFFLQPGENQEDLSFQLEDLERVPIGHNFTITVNIKNNKDKPRVMDVALSASSVFYNGITANLVKKASGKFTIKPNSKEFLRLVVTPDDYLDKLVEYCIMKIFAVITVKDTKQTWAAEDDFQVLKPNLDIKIPSELKLRSPVDVHFSFKNPINKILTDCKFKFEGPGLTKTVTLAYRDVQPMEEVRVQTSLTPTREGKLQLVAVFSSHDLIDITGSANVEVISD